MKVVPAIGVVLGSVFLQVVLARFAVGGRMSFDLVLVGVVFVALQAGPVAGMLSGTIGGLLLDLLSGGVIGVGGLLKTLIGFFAGLLGTRLVVAKPYARAMIVGAATLVHAFFALGLSTTISGWSGIPWAVMLGETAMNAIAGYLAFLAIESVPGAVGRGRARQRSAWGRRQW